MNCTDTLRSQDLPTCWVDSAQITGITVTPTSTAVIVHVKNKATGLINILDVTTGGAGEVIIEMDDIAPLYPHYYEIQVLNKPDRVSLELTANGETGCALYFQAYDNYTDPAESIALTTTLCLT